MLESPELDETRLEAMLDLAKERSAVLGARQHRRRLMSVALAVVVVLGIVGVVVGPGARPAPRQALHGGHAPTAAPAWRLVGAISPGSWQEQPSLDGSQSQYGIVCPTATTCYMQETNSSSTGDQAATTSIEVTQDGGATWKQLSLPDGTLTTTGLACVDASTCAAGAFDSANNAVFVTTDDAGQTWTSQPSPSQLSSSFQFFDVSCISAASCVAIGGVSGTGQSSAEAYYSLATTDGGQDWADTAYPVGFVPLTISCSPGGACETTGFEQSATPLAPNPVPVPESVPPAGVAGAALYSTDGGATWTAGSVPGDAGPIVSVSCDGQGDCSAVTFGDTSSDVTAGHLLTTGDGGQTWTEASGNGLPPSLLQGLSCPTSSYCWVGGAQLPADSGGSSQTPMPIDLSGLPGVLASTTDGGQTWQEALLPADLTNSVVTSVSCPTATTCLALDWRESPSQPATVVLLSYSS